MRLILLLGILLFNLQAKSLFSNDVQKDSSVYIENLKDLMIATQKTRGLSNSYLNGNTAALLLIYGNRDDMKRAIGKMESTSLASDPVINTRATSISKSLIKLNNVALKQDANKSFSEYTEQIAQILMLAQAVNKRSTKNLNPFANKASLIMMETMLPLTEYVGQLRGFGSGVAAKGNVVKSGIEKIYLLTHEVSTLNESLQAQMITLRSSNAKELPSTIVSDLATVDKLVKSYTFTANKTLIKSPENVDPDIYFDNGTALISAIIKVYNSCNSAILEDSKGWF